MGHILKLQSQFSNMRYIVLSLLLVLCRFESTVACYDYYWRDYTGKIPDDAVVAGEISNGRYVYIGQAFIQNIGLIVVQITPGSTEVEAPYNGTNRVDSYTKILCGEQRHFYWKNVTATNMHEVVADKHAVVGGHEPGGILTIGRGSIQGELVVGKVKSYREKNIHFYYVYQGKEAPLTSYQILLYQD